MMETREQREARWAAERAHQEEYRNSHEGRRAARIKEGLCVLENGFCVTHKTPDTMAHHFKMHPGAHND